MTPSRPPFIVSTTDVPEKASSYPQSEEKLAASRPIGKAAGLERIGLHVERLAPGTRTSWPHAESDEEEFVYVLEGEVRAWIDGVVHAMKAGDLVAFPAGTGVCHSILNEGLQGAVVLVGGERTKPTNRIFYPLHPGRRSQVRADEWWEDIPLGPQGPHDGIPRPPIDARPTLETQRLVLRPFSMQDADDVTRLAGDAAIASTTLVIPHPYAREDATRWIATHAGDFARGRFVHFVVADRANGTLLGAISLSIDPKHDHAEVGYWIGRPHWGHGYATEATQACLSYGFGRGLARIFAYHFVSNPASGRVLEKAGMIREGACAKYVKKDGVYEDCVLWAKVA
jgi:uncharacterized cupin superfamily protein/RimJ/RimL family protein N-acetyltransferase